MRETNPNHYTLNSINVIFIIGFAEYTTASVAFLVYDAKSMGEYGIVFFTLLAVIEATVGYFITIWELEDILKFIENCEKFIEKRE